ncbi:unnamed protein product [Haemonchus placei]|uniref:Uncharacterized protein n=1 Tax=Haemonchus placei TaxID=6290 RepID=A0A0N4X000_HAEPC|nr:unnamed protein product [Haemonchus placei]
MIGVSVYSALFRDISMPNRSASQSSDPRGLFELIEDGGGCDRSAAAASAAAAAAPAAAAVAAVGSAVTG